MRFVRETQTLKLKKSGKMKKRKRKKRMKKKGWKRIGI